MKKYYLLSLIVATALFTGCGSNDNSSNSENEDSEYKSSQYEGSDDDSNYVSSTNISYHNQGQNCLACHSFTSAGTVFTKLNAQNSDGTAYAGGHSIRLVLQYTNQVINYNPARGTANTYSQFNAGSVNSYTAQVVDAQGNVVNESIANSHDLTRLACNSCHTSTGASGAPGRIVSFDYYGTLSAPVTTTPVTTTPVTTTPVTTLPVTTTPSTTTISFANDVMPILTTNCKACHGSSGNFSVTTASATYTNIQGFGGINTASPTSSSLLLKGSGQVSHGGGSQISSTSTGYATIRDWIAAGANNN